MAASERRSAALAAQRVRMAAAKIRAQSEQTATNATDVYSFAPVLFALLDPSGLILDINAAGCRLLGATKSRLVGTPFRQYVVEDRNRPFVDHLRRARTGADAVESDLRLRTRDATLIARVYTRRARQDGKVVYPTAAIDVSDYASAERAREVAERTRDVAERERERAQTADAAKERLLAMVTHELRNPLSPALTAADSLMAMPDLPAAARQMAAIIKRNIEVEARLIDDLLDASRVKHGRLAVNLAHTDVHQVLLEAVTAAESSARSRGVRVSVDLQAAHHHAAADPIRLRQVFWNLLHNAIKFSHFRGEVLVRSVSDTPSRIRITIRDEGTGMDAETQRRLFQPFERRGPVGDARGGLGIGLAICKGIVEGHGGRISGTSSGPGRGAVFQLELQLAP